MMLLIYDEAAPCSGFVALQARVYRSVREGPVHAEV